MVCTSSSSLSGAISNLFPRIFGEWLCRNQKQTGVIRPSITTFSFESLQKATNNFTNLLGPGRVGCSSRFKGILEDDTKVTVVVYSHTIDVWSSVIRILPRTSHRNVVGLIGSCFEARNILVYEYVGECNLEDLLFNNDRSSELNWARRASICLGIARGLEYLHQGIAPFVIHRDVKPSNVLLDDSFNPKIAGFTCAVLVENNDFEFIAPDIAGSNGYIAPEYAKNVRINEKTDVYSFGVVLLEVISGRMSVGSFGEGIDIVQWAKSLYKTGQVMRIVDPRLTEFPEEEVVRCINVALLCVQENSSDRPSMFEVWPILSGFCDFSRKVLKRLQTLHDHVVQDRKGCA